MTQVKLVKLQVGALGSAQSAFSQQMLSAGAQSSGARHVLVTTSQNWSGGQVLSKLLQLPSTHKPPLGAVQISSAAQSLEAVQPWHCPFSQTRPPGHSLSGAQSPEAQLPFSQIIELPHWAEEVQPWQKFWLQPMPSWQSTSKEQLPGMQLPCTSLSQT
jgi:hypothetical protein